MVTFGDDAASVTAFTPEVLADLAAFKVFGGDLLGLHYSPDGSMLAAQSRKKVMIWDATSGSPLTAREPGVVGAALADPDTWVGVIADGHHVHPASLKVAHQAKAAGKLYLVSDSMATVGADTPEFEIYGETISVKDGRLVNREGNLAGSAIGLADAVRYSHQVVGLPLAECLRMASLYPAQFMGIDAQMGRLAPGAEANLAWLNADLQVGASWLSGQVLDHPLDSPVQGQDN